MRPAILAAFLMGLLLIGCGQDDADHAGQRFGQRAVEQVTSMLTTAAEKGDKRSQVGLGIMYLEGVGVAKDFAKALFWLSQASEQGDCDAMFKLGVMMREGYAVPTDRTQAHKWFSLAAARGQAEANPAREQLESLMSKEEIAQAQVLASQWSASHPGL